MFWFHFPTTVCELFWEFCVILFRPLIGRFSMSVVADVTSWEFESLCVRILRSIHLRNRSWEWSHPRVDNIPVPTSWKTKMDAIVSNTSWWQHGILRKHHRNVSTDGCWMVLWVWLISRDANKTGLRIKQNIMTAFYCWSMEQPSWILWSGSVRFFRLSKSEIRGISVEISEWELGNSDFPVHTTRPQVLIRIQKIFIQKPYGAKPLHFFSRLPNFPPQPSGMTFPNILARPFNEQIQHAHYTAEWKSHPIILLAMKTPSFCQGVCGSQTSDHFPSFPLDTMLIELGVTHKHPQACKNRASVFGSPTQPSQAAHRVVTPDPEWHAGWFLQAKGVANSMSSCDLYLYGVLCLFEVLVGKIVVCFCGGNVGGHVS